MCKCGNKLTSRILLLLITALLGACGGSANDESVTPNNNRTDGNNPASSKAVVENSQSSVPALQPSSLAVNSSVQSIALEKDTTPPSTTQLLLQQLSENSITLAWDDATDNARINNYKIERNGQFIATLNYPAHAFTDTDLQSYTAYTYTITAVDSSGNDSKVSSPFTVRTLSGVSSKSSTSTINNPPADAGPKVESSTHSVVSTSSKVASSTNSTASTSSKAASSVKSTSSTSSKAASSVKSTASTSSKAASSQNSSLKSSSSKAASSSSVISSAASSSSDSAKPKTAKISWDHPKQRENGQFLELEEIGGYEIRYRKPTDVQYSYITVDNNETNEYTIDDANGLEFEIAVFDINGVYSQFVKVSQ